MEFIVLLAAKVQAAWAAKKPRERGEILRKAYEVALRDAKRWPSDIMLHLPSIQRSVGTFSSRLLYNVASSFA
jgi:hypothetical protein